MKQNQRVLSAFLALVMLLTLLPLPMAGAAGTAVYNGVTYSTDYTTWQQGEQHHQGQKCRKDTFVLLHVRIPPSLGFDA